MLKLKEKTLETGSRTITAVQYENNDPKGKVIRLFNQATFEQNLRLNKNKKYITQKVVCFFVWTKVGKSE